MKWIIFVSAVLVSCGPDDWGRFDMSFVSPQSGGRTEFGTYRVNVKAFGAIGDGVHDDGPAFQAAINFITDTSGIVKGGGVVYVPSSAAGYRISTPVQKSFGADSPSWGIEGDGGTSTRIYVDTGPNADCFGFGVQGSNSLDFWIRGLRFLPKTDLLQTPGFTTANAKRVISIVGNKTNSNLTRITLEDISFYGLRTSPVDVDNLYSNPLLNLEGCGKVTMRNWGFYASDPRGINKRIVILNALTNAWIEAGEFVDVGTINGDNWLNSLGGICFLIVPPPNDAGYENGPPPGAFSWGDYVFKGIYTDDGVGGFIDVSPGFLNRTRSIRVEDYTAISPWANGVPNFLIRSTRFVEFDQVAVAFFQNPPNLGNVPIADIKGAEHVTFKNVTAEWYGSGTYSLVRMEEGTVSAEIAESTVNVWEFPGVQYAHVTKGGITSFYRPTASAIVANTLTKVSGSDNKIAQLGTSDVSASVWGVAAESAAAANLYIRNTEEPGQVVPIKKDTVALARGAYVKPSSSSAGRIAVASSGDSFIGITTEAASGTVGDELVMVLLKQGVTP